MQLRLTAPLRVMDKIEVNLSVPEGRDGCKYTSKVFSAKVVRVNRGESILDANQSVAVTFVL